MRMPPVSAVTTRRTLTVSLYMEDALGSQEVRESR